MKTVYNLNEIKKIFQNGNNVIEFLKKSDYNLGQIEQILISYDFQAGSYIKGVERDNTYINNYTRTLADEINGLGDFSSIMEIGVGEATTLAHLLPKLNNNKRKVLGFDISWSRLRYAKKYLKDKSIDDVNLFIGDLFNIPLPDNSIDIIYTSHSIEPNGGREREALQELYRVSSNYLVLLEPSYHFGNDIAKERMIKHGYIKNLKEQAVNLGYNIQEYRLFEHCSNPNNPTELIIIKKEKKSTNSTEFMCPISKENLVKNENEFYSKDGMFVYPIISGIPCLLTDNAVIATKYTDFL